MITAMAAIISKEPSLHPCTRWPLILQEGLSGLLHVYFCLAGCLVTFLAWKSWKKGAVLVTHDMTMLRVVWVFIVPVALVESSSLATSQIGLLSKKPPIVSVTSQHLDLDKTFACPFDNVVRSSLSLESPPTCTFR